MARWLIATTEDGPGPVSWEEVELDAEPTWDDKHWHTRANADYASQVKEHAESRKLWGAFCWHPKKKKWMAAMTGNTTNPTYQLQIKDYLELYPFLTPEEIQDEFQDMACSARHIRRIYKTQKLPSVDDALDDVVKKSFAYCDLDFSADEWAAYVTEKIKDHRIKRIEGVYQRAARYAEIMNQ